MKRYNVNDVLLKHDYDKICHELNQKWNYANEIEPGKNVCFDSAVQISRREFKKQYPDNPIVHDLSKADYYVTNNKLSAYFNFYSSNAVNLGNDGWRGDYRLNELNKMVDFISGNAVPIQPKKIKFTSENGEIPEEMVQKIQQMLQSPDKETLDLGIKILFQYDHINSIDKFYVLLSRANYVTFWKRTKSRVTEQKIKYIKEQFPNHRF